MCLEAVGRVVSQKKKPCDGGLAFSCFSLVEPFCTSVFSFTSLLYTRNPRLTSSLSFRYVAMHTMQDTNPSAHSHSSHTSHHSHSQSFSSHETNGFLDGPHGYAGPGDPGRGRKEGGMTLKLTLAAVAGMLLPLITQVGHVH